LLSFAAGFDDTDQDRKNTGTCFRPCAMADFSQYDPVPQGAFCFVIGQWQMWKFQKRKRGQKGSNLFVFIDIIPACLTLKGVKSICFYRYHPSLSDFSSAVDAAGLPNISTPMRQSLSRYLVRVYKHPSMGCL